MRKSVRHTVRLVGRKNGRYRVGQKFRVGTRVSWNSEAGKVSGKITKVHTSDVQYKGHTRHCTPDDPQYEIKSDKTDHVAMHKGSALHRVD